MRPEPLTLRANRGFGLVAAMFVMIIISLVVIAMSRLASVQHGSNALAIQQARAYQAARAGLEWGISQAVNAGLCAAGTPSLAGSGLGEFTVTLTCSTRDYPGEGGAILTIYQLTARAENGAPGSRPDYAFRSLTAVVER